MLLLNLAGELFSKLLPICAQLFQAGSDKVLHNDCTNKRFSPLKKFPLFHSKQILSCLPLSKPVAHLNILTPSLPVSSLPSFVVLRLLIR